MSSQRDDDQTDAIGDQRIIIEPNYSVNGLVFGCSCQTLWERLGEPTRALENYNGELELLYDDYFFRCLNDRFVECTFPGTYQFYIRDVRILSVLDWLRGQPDHVEKARFHISPGASMAFDLTNPTAGSVTLFEPGRWDFLLQQ